MDVIIFVSKQILISLLLGHVKMTLKIQVMRKVLYLLKLVT